MLDVRGRGAVLPGKQKITTAPANGKGRERVFSFKALQEFLQAESAPEQHEGRRKDEEQDEHMQDGRIHAPAEAYPYALAHYAADGEDNTHLKY